MEPITPEACGRLCGSELRRIRSYLHSHPELSLQEHSTTKFILETLEGIGVEAVDMSFTTGCVGVIRACHAHKKYKDVVLRADIDALPVTEATGSADTSQNEGVMHACGHDIHTAGLLGAAMLLQQRRDELENNVILLFQSAEENVAGAKQVIDAGLFTRFNVGAVFGLHVWPAHPLGKVGLRTGPVLSAKDSFKIWIHGRGGHGSAPHRTTDPIVAGAALISNLQALISRECNPFDCAVLSVCSIHAGNCDNIIPDMMTVEGSIRTMRVQTREKLLRRMQTVAESTAASYGCTVEFDADSSKAVPAVVNDESLGSHAENTAKRVFGASATIMQEQTLASEDFARYGAFAPSYYYLLGVAEDGMASYELHNPSFYPNWRAACYAAALLAGSAVG